MSTSYRSSYNVLINYCGYDYIKQSFKAFPGIPIYMYVLSQLSRSFLASWM